MNNSLIEPPFIPIWAKRFREDLFFIYNGASMAPLFKTGDILCARKSALENIQTGDIVIVDRRVERTHNDYVVHRVMAVRQGCLITQGDNNLMPDHQMVTSENLVGCVTAFGRQNHVYPIRGGYVGLFYARLIHARNIIWNLIKCLGWRIYRLVRQSGLAAKIWRPAIGRVRVVTDNGFLIKYCYGDRTVAYWWPETKKFDVIKPFDLVIPNPQEPK
jgi:signal peptidase I